MRCIHGDPTTYEANAYANHITKQYKSKSHYTCILQRQITTKEHCKGYTSLEPNNQVRYKEQKQVQTYAYVDKK